MGKVRIRHYRIRKGRAYWEPAPKMRAAGFKVIALGPDGPDAWQKAERMNAEWDKARADGTAVEVYERGTLGWHFDDYRKRARGGKRRTAHERSGRTLGPSSGLSLPTSW